MASLVVELAALLSNVGIGSIVIQKPRLKRTDLDTAFWASVGLGTCLSFLVCIASLGAARFFGIPELVSVMCWLSLLFPLEALALVHNNLLSRQLRFREDFAIQATILTTRVLSTIVLAYAGLGVWGLVLGSLIGRGLGTVLGWYIVPFLPRLRFDLTFLRSNLKAGGSYLGSGILSYALSNIDYWVIGRRFGAEALGYYQVAFSLPEELRNRLSGPLQRVLFPAYSLLSGNDQAFREGVVRSLSLLATVVIPMGVGMAVLAEQLVAVLYGENWAPVVPLLQILAIGGSVRAVFSLTANIFYARNRPDLALKISFVSLPIVITTVLGGSHWGPVGVAWAMLILQTTAIVSAALAFRLIGLSIITLYHCCWRPVLCSLPMAASVLGVGIEGKRIGAEPLAVLTVEILFGCLTYVLFSVLLNRPMLRDVASLISRAVPRQFARTSRAGTRGC
jgi:PST family polysaccharide transporter